MAFYNFLPKNYRQLANQKEPKTILIWNNSKLLFRNWPNIFQNANLHNVINPNP